MNLVTSLAAYAAMSRELGLPLRFPGTKEGWNTLQDTTDAELFGRATLWALGEDKARNEIFNVSNGDVYRWRQLWNELAAFYDLPIAEPLAMSTVSEMSEKAPLWDAIVARYGLHATPYNQIANWAFVDWMLNFGEEVIQSTSRFVRRALRIASTHIRALGGSSPDYAICGSSPRLKQREQNNVEESRRAPGT